MSIRKGNSIISGKTVIDSAITPNSSNPVTGGAIYTAVHTLDTEIEDINAVIPTQATSSNQLADKAFVNSSIANNTANFIGTFNSLADLQAYSGPVTNNDYAFVATTTGGVTNYDRYKYTTATTPASWVFEYTLNNSSFTANQWDAINSNATQALIAQITTNQQNITAHTTDTNNPHNVTKAQVGLGNVDNTADIDKPLSTAMTNALALKANTADLGTMAEESASDYTKTANFATVALSGDYDDLSNKPTIPAAQVNSDWDAVSGVAQILNKPTLGSAAAADTTDFATAAQGTLAGTALQPGDNVSSLVNDAGYLTSATVPNGIEWATYGTTTYQEISDWIDAGKAVFCYYDRNPDNPVLSEPHLYMAIKRNSISIWFTSLEAGASAWQTPLEYMYIGAPGSFSPGWHRGQTRLQNEIHAGTSGEVLTYTGSAGVIGSTALSTVATSGDYDDLSNTPTIPTVNDATITITQGGVTKGSFTLNQASGDTIALDAGGGSSLPSQTGNAGKFLTTDGTNASWATLPASGILLEYKEFDHDPNISGWVKPTINDYYSASQYPETYNYLYNEWMTPNTSANYYAWTSGGMTIYTNTATPTTSDYWWEINTNPTSANPVGMQTYLIVSGPGSVIDYVAADYSYIEDIMGAPYTRDSSKDIDAIRSFETETIAGITISYYNSVHGLKMVDMGSNITGVYNATGDAWYYGIATYAAGTSFTLPVRKIRKLVRAGGTSSRWYRLYSDGWVEQGGSAYVGALGHQIDLPITMNGTSYTLTLGGKDPSGDAGIVAYAYRTKNAGNFIVDAGYAGTFYPGDLGWTVSGQSTVTPKGEDYYFYVK